MPKEERLLAAATTLMIIEDVLPIVEKIKKKRQTAADYPSYMEK